MATGFHPHPTDAGHGSSGLSGETFNHLDAQLSEHVGQRFSGHGLGRGSSECDLFDHARRLYPVGRLYSVSQLYKARLDGAWFGRKEPVDGSAERPLRADFDCLQHAQRVPQPNLSEDGKYAALVSESLSFDGSHRATLQRQPCRAHGRGHDTALRQ